jgi:hypothetical protein
MDTIKIIKEVIKEFFSDDDDSPRLSDKRYQRLGIQNSQTNVQTAIKDDAELFGFVGTDIKGRMINKDPVAVYKNPKTLRGIEYGARGVLMSDGTFYIGKKSSVLHDEILDLLVEKRVITADKTIRYGQNKPEEYIAMERKEMTNSFSPSSVYSELPIYYYDIIELGNKAHSFTFNYERDDIDDLFYG